MMPGIGSVSSSRATNVSPRAISLDQSLLLPAAQSPFWGAACAGFVCPQPAETCTIHAKNTNAHLMCSTSLLPNNQEGTKTKALGAALRRQRQNTGVSGQPA